ncbi:MAG: GNAT family N-acetyltransferase [Chitinophagaceae bacterium]
MQLQVFSIRKAGIADIPLIRELTFQVWPQTYASLLSGEQIGYMLEMMYSETSLQKQMEEGAKFIIVYEGQEPVGFASWQLNSPAVYKLHKIYVLPFKQRKGTGRYIIDQLIHEIKGEGASALQLQVNRNNKAKSFYEKLGFKVIDELKLDIGNGYFMDDYIMQLEL